MLHVEVLLLERLGDIEEAHRVVRAGALLADARPAASTLDDELGTLG